MNFDSYLLLFKLITNSLARPFETQLEASALNPRGKNNAILDVEVAIDIGEIQQKIQRSIGIDVVHVSATGNQVTLTGLVPDTVVADRALSVAKGLAGDAVVNAMQIAPSQQVMLEVRFLEVARTAGRDLGVNLFLANSSGTRGFNTGAPGISSRLRKPVRGLAACRFSQRPVRC
jgi:pilus assembly protein CpaC